MHVLAVSLTDLAFPEGFGLVALLAVAAAIAGLELQFLALDADGGAGRNGMGDEHVGTDDRVPADDCTAAQNGRAGVDGHMVFDGGMTLLATETLTAAGGERAQGNALVDLHVIANSGGLTDDDAGTMVNEEILAHSGAGVDVDTGNGVGMLGHDSGQHGNPHGVQNVGQTVDSDGIQTGIAVDDLIHAESRGVALEEGFHVGLGNGTDRGDLPEELQAQFLGLFLGGALLHSTLEHQTDLLIQIVHHIFNEHGQIVPGVVDAVSLLLGIAGVNDPQQLADHIDDDLLIRITLGRQLVNGTAVTVVLQNGVHDAFDLGFNGSHNRFLLGLQNLFISLAQ